MARMHNYIARHAFRTHTLQRQQLTQTHIYNERTERENENWRASDSQHEQPLQAEWSQHRRSTCTQTTSRNCTDEPFPDSSCRANLHKRGLAQSPSCDCGRRQTMNHIVNTCPLYKIWRRTESTPWSRRWCSHMVGIYSDCSTREILLTCKCRQQ